MSLRPAHKALLSYTIILGLSKQPLQSMQDLLAQQGKSCSAKHHPLDEFNSGHLTFHLPIAVNKC